MITGPKPTPDFTPAQRAVQKKLEINQHVPSKKNASQWILKNLCQSTSASLSAIDNIPFSVDAYTKDLIKRTTATFHAPSETFKGLAAGAEDITQTISEELSKALKPLPLGSIVDTATGLTKDAMGSLQNIPNTLTSLVDKISPQFATQMDSALKSINIDNLQHLPSKMLGGLRNLTTAVDSILSMPFELVSDLHGGVLKLLDKITDMTDALMDIVKKFFVGFAGLLDQEFPISQIISFVDPIGKLSGAATGLIQKIGAFDLVNNLSKQVSGLSSQFSSILSDPLKLASSYIPQLQQGMDIASQVTGALRDPQQALQGLQSKGLQAIQGKGLGAISQFAGSIRNPQQAIQQFLPPQIGSQLGGISKLPGLGFVGNFGFSVGSTLDSLGGSFFEKAAGQFSNQLGILGPLFNKVADQAGPALTNLNLSGPKSFEPSDINKTSQVGTGNLVQMEDTSAYVVFTEKQTEQALNQVNFAGLQSGPSPFKVPPAAEKPWLKQNNTNKLPPLVMTPSPPRN